MLQYTSVGVIELRNDDSTPGPDATFRAAFETNGHSLFTISGGDMSRPHYEIRIRLGNGRDGEILRLAAIMQ